MDYSFQNSINFTFLQPTRIDINIDTHHVGLLTSNLEKEHHNRMEQQILENLRITDCPTWTTGGIQPIKVISTL